MSDYISKEETINTIWKTFDSFADNPSNFELEETYAIRRFCFKLQEEMKEQPTLDEKEIIRKCGEQIVDKLKNLYALNPYPNLFSNGRDYANIRAINLVKEECGINE